MSHSSFIFTFFCSLWLLSCRQVIDVQAEIEQLWSPLQAALQVMNKIQTELRQTQLDRQRDIWMQMVSLHIWHYYCCVSFVLIHCCHLEQQTASTASKISLMVPWILISFSWILGIMARCGSKVASPKSISEWGRDMPWLKSWSLGIWRYSLIPWRRRQQFSLKHWYSSTKLKHWYSSTKLCAITSLQILILVLTTVSIACLMLLLVYHWPEDTSLWDVTLCQRASDSQHFEGQLRLRNPEDVDSTHLWKVRSHSRSNTA